MTFVTQCVYKCIVIGPCYVRRFQSKARWLLIVEKTNNHRYIVAKGNWLSVCVCVCALSGKYYSVIVSRICVIWWRLHLEPGLQSSKRVNARNIIPTFTVFVCVCRRLFPMQTAGCCVNIFARRTHDIVWRCVFSIFAHNSKVKRRASLLRSYARCTYPN